MLQGHMVIVISLGILHGLCLSVVFFHNLNEKTATKIKLLIVKVFCFLWKFFFIINWKHNISIIQLFEPIYSCHMLPTILIQTLKADEEWKCKTKYYLSYWESIYSELAYQTRYGQCCSTNSMFIYTLTHLLTVFSKIFGTLSQLNLYS